MGEHSVKLGSTRNMSLNDGGDGTDGDDDGKGGGRERGRESLQIIFSNSDIARKGNERNDR